jgi:hypothetical protein
MSRFLQSTNDFPLMVKLGEKSPFFGLYRFRQGLRFIPSDDEGFTMRGDKQRLQYKGRRRSHRFTILGDTAFEYDCILEKEPESNVITLLIEGAEKYDFFRQPDFVPDNFLKGSYAVYKKDTLLGEGTGKLCHIHRPEIIDARGRRCWGDLAVAGNELRITIPDWFLSGAKYPVIVDPTIGTTTVGSQSEYLPAPNNPPRTLLFEVQIPVNCFKVTAPLNGSCMGYFYTDRDDDDAGGRAVIYSDAGDKPQYRLTKNEDFIDFRVTSNKPAGWKSGSFSISGSIAGNAYVWFGAFCEYFWYPRFDYGSKCYKDFNDGYRSIPDIYPLYNVNHYENFKLSMYFTCDSGQSYVRTLTQGVTLSDNRIIAVDYKRVTEQTVQASTSITRLLAIFKKIQDSISISDILKKMFLHFRYIQEVLNTSDTLSHFRALFRGLYEIARTEDETKTGYIHFRAISETAHVVSTVLRGMVFFVHIVTLAAVRDYILGRFLKAKTEITLKSCVVREIVLESRINA